ncbi:hypothetical protein [Cupriavidus metallidurans]|uniref:Uncharacterized protein n=1 Tax=Cupriavidus metallidurans TaxID=119219 RepID=A0A482IPG8_9BURK|nr:hypothetical protein [Cupriavidus metallidurans]QBP09822.1 hypothetical protein DDF84_008645 [Cupriavidus metallidurans]
MTIPDSQVKSDFETAASTPIEWRPELLQLAIGYLGSIYIAADANDPVEIHESTAMGISLVVFAASIGWISERAMQGLILYAHAARSHALGRSVLASDRAHCPEPLH